MESFGVPGFSDKAAVIKKRRSTVSRRPRPDPALILENLDVSPPSSTPSSDNASKFSTDGSSGNDIIGRRKDFNLNSTAQRLSHSNRTEGLNAPKRVKRDDKSYGDSDGLCGTSSSRGGFYGSNEQGRNASDLKRSSKGVLAPASWKNTSKIPSKSPDPYIDSGGSGTGRNAGPLIALSNGSAENKTKKLKLKLVGGVTRTLQAKSNVESGSDGGASTAKSPQFSDSARQPQKHNPQENSGDDNHSPPENKNGMHGIPWKDFSVVDFSAKENLRGKVTKGGISGKQTDKSFSLASAEPVRKSKRVPKRRVLDGELDEDGDEDDEIRYLEKLRTSKISSDIGSGYGDDGLDGDKKQKLLKLSKSRKAVYTEDEDFALSRRSKDGKKKPRSERGCEDMDYIEEEDQGSDDALEAKRRKQKIEAVDSVNDGKKEISLTTRQRALQSGKDGSGGNGASLIEFPHGLPPAPPRKQKEKLSEVEQQLKKAEAAQRRRMQVEKAARESEAEAIRKILGQDSSRKKREDKLRKRRDELAQEKAANSLTLASNSVRWVIGPTGTTVTFPESVGLPSIFNTRTCSYPPPREKCAGPSCNNTYKYRDSKSNLPLCSLQCYKAVQQSSQTVSTC